MTKLKGNSRHIIYLDQYCTSNMFDNEDDLLWQEIKELLFEGVAQQKFLCFAPSHMNIFSRQHPKTMLQELILYEILKSCQGVTFLGKN
ncbi:hypothetical protein Q766_06605 [Flavobacterium subsaxonicum WB 4.1-42 = DSM 21790]|uniref:Uncharacterized protein n=1 Tax=Flavobacterium subsaxonicum WB 4.1-42 = DSM 21790 TaxID=1121898 RepID=A0A0A2MMV2_9FLAO|nr:hypothetical protein Q766_06605 [Flavobacterium subsaxonicum WB 4.1-42 = DSM 21790]